MAIARLLRDIDPDAVAGRIILLPVANVPALRAARRNADIDGLNLARVFPGNHRGRPTERIAAYIHDELLAQATHLIDLHAGGRSLAILPSAQVLLTPAVDARAGADLLGLAGAAGLPVIVNHGAGDSGTSVGAAVNRGIRALALELGEGAFATVASVDAAAVALQRLLVATGVLRSEAVPVSATAPRFRMGGWRDHLTAPFDGWFERGFRLGQHVAAGEFAGRMHDLLQPESRPAEIHFPAEGIVYAHARDARVRAGASLSVVIREDGA
jgi:predicted deacylase